MFINPCGIFSKACFHLIDVLAVCGLSCSTKKRYGSSCSTTKRCGIGRCGPSFSTTNRCSSTAVLRFCMLASGIQNLAVQGAALSDSCHNTIGMLRGRQLRQADSSLHRQLGAGEGIGLGDALASDMTLTQCVGCLYDLSWNTLQCPEIPFHRNLTVLCSEDERVFNGPPEWAAAIPRALPLFHPHSRWVPIFPTLAAIPRSHSAH